MIHKATNGFGTRRRESRWISIQASIFDSNCLDPWPAAQRISAGEVPLEGSRARRGRHAEFVIGGWHGPALDLYGACARLGARSARRHAARGGHPWDATVEATSHRFRPILLTAAAAILGMISIAPTVFWGPMAYAIMGGLAVATLLTPALYVAWFHVKEPSAKAAAR